MTTRVWNSRLGWAALAALVLVPTSSGAQVRPRGPGPDRGAMEQRVRARFGEMVRSELNLSADQLQKVEQVVGSFEEQRRDLTEREMTLRRRMRPAAQRTDDEAQQILREMVAVRDEEIRLFRGEMEELRKTLRPAQALRFYELRAELMDRVQRLRQPGPNRPGADGGLGPPAGGPPPER